MKYSYNNKQNISFQDQYEQHPPKVKYFPNNSVPKLVIRRVGDTAYDSYIAETLSTEEYHQAEEADLVCRRPSEQCHDHTSKEDQVTPSQMDHQS